MYRTWDALIAKGGCLRIPAEDYMQFIRYSIERGLDFEEFFNRHNTLDVRFPGVLGDSSVRALKRLLDIIPDMRFSDSINISSVDLRGVHMEYARLRYANLRNAKLDGMHLDHATLINADLT